MGCSSESTHPSYLVSACGAVEFSLLIVVNTNLLLLLVQLLCHLRSTVARQYPIDYLLYTHE